MKGSSDPEYVFTSERTGTTTDVVQDIRRAREIAAEGTIYLLSDTDARVNKELALVFLKSMN